MTRSWCTAGCWFATCIAASLLSDGRQAVAEPTSSATLAVRGGMVDPDAPATYRLPLIGLCDPAEERIALRAEISPKFPSRGAGGTAPNASTPDSASVASAAALAVPPTTGELTKQLLPAVQRGYNLAERGAFFAARTEFIQVLRRVAQAKDASLGTDDHSRALAAGLRAMDEADDFVPAGAQLEAEMDMRSVASSHRTPVLRDYPQEVLPHEAIALYHGFAQQQLSFAAVDERAGSMALYGLGNVYARLSERRDDDVQCVRGAMTMYSAALDSCPDNNLAANELGVMMCRTGHPEEAVQHFERAITIAPSATTYHNLAVAQQKLNQMGSAAANEQESQRLAALERAAGSISQRAGIEWVSPAELARASQAEPSTPSVATPAPSAQPPASAIRRWR